LSLWYGESDPLACVWLLVTAFCDC